MLVITHAFQRTDKLVGVNLATGHAQPERCAVICFIEASNLFYSWLEAQAAGSGGKVQMTLFVGI